ncbi:MAG TPA: VOC family protein, partial [Candidatus Lustribacter sp.]|nr:VOC family protein [Candidatus Lustribacter sp.]
MRVDHVSYAAEHDGLRATADRLAKLIGVDSVDGGVHPRFGTRNIILPLADERYVEVVEVLDHPASDKAPFGQAVRARSEAGGGWLGWVIRIDDITVAEHRVGRSSVEGYRHRPDGAELRWRQVGVKGLMADPQLPYFVQWMDPSLHPSRSGRSDCHLVGLQIAGDPGRVKHWLGLPDGCEPSTLQFDFVAPH